MRVLAIGGVGLALAAAAAGVAPATTGGRWTDADGSQTLTVVAPDAAPLAASPSSFDDFPHGGRR